MRGVCVSARGEAAWGQLTGRGRPHVALAEVGAVGGMDAAQRVANRPEGRGAALRPRIADSGAALAPTGACRDGGDGGADVCREDGLAGEVPAHRRDEGLEAHTRENGKRGRVLDLLHHAAGGRDAWGPGSG